MTTTRRTLSYLFRVVSCVCRTNSSIASPRLVQLSKSGLWRVSIQSTFYANKTPLLNRHWHLFHYPRLRRPWFLSKKTLTATPSPCSKITLPVRIPASADFSSRSNSKLFAVPGSVSKTFDYVWRSNGQAPHPVTITDVSSVLPSIQQSDRMNVTCCFVFLPFNIFFFHLINFFVVNIQVWTFQIHREIHTLIGVRKSFLSFVIRIGAFPFTLSFCSTDKGPSL